MVMGRVKRIVKGDELPFCSKQISVVIVFCDIGLAGSPDPDKTNFIKLKGNSHMMMMDQNSDHVSGLIQQWLLKRWLMK